MFERILTRGDSCVVLDTILGVWTAPEDHLHDQRARLYVNCIAVRKYNFLDFFLFCFVYKIFAVTILKYHTLNWKDVSVTNVDIFDKKQFSLQFFFSLLQVYTVCIVSYLLCWPRGRGIGLLVCTRRFSFHEFYNFLLFNFLIFIFLDFFFFFFTHDNYPHPRPTTFSYTPFPLTATTKIEPDTNSFTSVLNAARFWPQRWLAVITMPQDLIGCWNKRKLKTLIPLVVVFADDQPSAERRIDFAVFFYCFMVL